jgi:hypothetical protein
VGEEIGIVRGQGGIKGKGREGGGGGGDNERAYDASCFLILNASRDISRDVRMFSCAEKETQQMLRKSKRAMATQGGKAPCWWETR